MATVSQQISVSVQDGKSVPLGKYTGGPKIAYKPTDLAATKVYQASQAATASPVTYDATSGLADVFGNALVYTTVSCVVINNTHATASLVVGGGTHPLFGSDQYTVQPNKCLVVPACPATVTGGSATQITVTPSASATWQVLICGS